MGMGIRLLENWTSHLIVLVVLALALVMQPNAMAFAVQAQAAVQTRAATDHGAHRAHAGHQAAQDQVSIASDEGSNPDCVKSGCGGMHCDTNAVIFTGGFVLCRVDVSRAASLCSPRAESGSEPPVQPPRS